MSDTNCPPLNRWLGNTIRSEDRIAPLERLEATLGALGRRPGDALPALWHWAFFQPTEDEAALGSDGHPARDGLLPPAKGRNRMWAGERLTFQRPLNVGNIAVRDSKIIDIQEKQGRSGALLFVTERHNYSPNGETAVTEEQEIVYREPSAPRLSLNRPVPAADWSTTITPSLVLLFRYSAVTFNGHRIHYDCERVLQRPELATDERFNTNSRRSANRDRLRALIHEAFAEMTADGALARLDDAGIANARVNDMAGVWGHPQLAERDRWRRISSPAGELPALLPPAVNRAFEPRMDAVPDLGEHTRSILSELDDDTAAVERLLADGAV